MRGLRDEADRLLEEGGALVLERRNQDGKTPLMLAVEHDRGEIFELLFSRGADVAKKDSKQGNNVMHLACRKGNAAAVARVFAVREEMCLQQNFHGETAFHVAASSGSLECLQAMDKYKVRSLAVRNVEGENPLFTATRAGNREVFRWFQGQLDFFKARGERNYRGQTIEHVCCMLMQREIVEDINPQPDTRDYYGNLPLFYTVMNNDELNAATFQHGKNYYHLRNYKQETLFHVAAKHNSVQALETLNKRAVFFEELIKKDFKGDTPFHLAAKAGALEMMRYLMRSATAPFLSI